MKYENAKDILPAALLEEVQKYAAGKLLYVPVENETKGWGETSGYRQKLLKRNVMISNRYKAGATLSELAEEYFLSLDSIKKIVYGKKEKELLFEPTVAAAVRYANAGLLEEWLTLYYQYFCGGNDISFESVVCCGVRKVPLRLLEEVSQEKSKSTDVENDIIEDVPLIVLYRNGRFEVEEQLQLFRNLRIRKINAYPSLIMVPQEEYLQFERQYGRYFVVVN